MTRRIIWLIRDDDANFIVNLDDFPGNKTIIEKDGSGLAESRDGCISHGDELEEDTLDSVRKHMVFLMDDKIKIIIAF